MLQSDWFKNPPALVSKGKVTLDYTIVGISLVLKNIKMSDVGIPEFTTEFSEFNSQDSFGIMAGPKQIVAAE